MNMDEYQACLGRMFELEECIRSYGEMQENHYILNSICTFSNMLHHERVLLVRLGNEEMDSRE